MFSYLTTGCDLYSQILRSSFLRNIDPDWDRHQKRTGESPKVFSCLWGSQNIVTLWTVTLQAPLSMEFSRQEYCSELPFPPPGDLPGPGMEPTSPTLQADSLPSQPPGKPNVATPNNKWNHIVGQENTYLLNKVKGNIIHFIKNFNYLGAANGRECVMEQEFYSLGSWQTTTWTRSSPCQSSFS